MPAKPINEKDRELLRLGLEVWQAAQLQAGGSAEDIVQLKSDEDGKAVRRVRLGDIDGLTEEYIDALQDLGEDQTALDWRRDSWVELTIEDEDSDTKTAVIAIDLAFECQPRGADFALGDGGLRLRIDHRSSYESEEKEPQWIDPLSPAYVPLAGRYDDGHDIVFGAGVVAAIKASSGVSWLPDPAPRPIIRIYGIVVLPKFSSDYPNGKHLIDRATGYAGFTAVNVTQIRSLGILLRQRYTTAQELVRALTDREGRFVEIAQSLEACRGDWSALAALGQMEHASRGVEFVVPGFIPAGVVTLVAGAAGTGKSTLLHDLAITVATDPTERDPLQHWLGVPAKDIASGNAVFMCVEDNGAIVAARRHQLRAGLKPGGLFEVCASGRPLADLLAFARRLDLKLLVVDPARAFMSGSEDESGPADGFMAPLVQFATETGCAVVVVHHLKKGASPASPEGVRECIRGSQVFVDRPRAIIGLTNRRETVSAAVIKNNIPPAFPMNMETRSFQRNATTLRLDDHADPRPDKVGRADIKADESVDAVVAAISQAHAGGTAVTRTGRRGVFESELPGLETLARNAVRAAVDEAIASGRLRALPNKLIVPAEAALPALPAAELARPATATSAAVNAEM